MSSLKNTVNNPDESEEDEILMLEAAERLKNHGDKPSIPMSEVMARLGITEKDLDAFKDVEIERCAE